MDIEYKERVRCLALFSGGLDSQLAVCVLKDQGIDVHAVVFRSPFFAVEHTGPAALRLGVPLHAIDFSNDILGLLASPPHGFGSCMNPCIDCHALMVRRAGELMEDMALDFLCTGEVLNERPMSQNRSSLQVVARDSGYADLLLRPLSARLLPETAPERLGQVDRERLLDIAGRGRKPQMRLAEHYGLVDYPSPAGGCRLTEPNFCLRLAELRDHEGLAGKRSINLLRYGRHFRLGDRAKLIVGRNEQDNAVLEGAAELYDLVLNVDDGPGPTGLLPFTVTEDEILCAAAICLRYSDCPQDQPGSVRVRSSQGMRRVSPSPMAPDEVEALRV